MMSIIAVIGLVCLCIAVISLLTDMEELFAFFGTVFVIVSIICLVNSISFDNKNDNSSMNINSIENIKLSKSEYEYISLCLNTNNCSIESYEKLLYPKIKDIRSQDVTLDDNIFFDDVYNDFIQADIVSRINNPSGITLGDIFVHYKKMAPYINGKFKDILTGEFITDELKVISNPLVSDNNNFNKPIYKDSVLNLITEDMIKENNKCKYPYELDQYSKYSNIEFKKIKDYINNCSKK